jgi:hypothetical protein
VRIDLLERLQRCRRSAKTSTLVMAVLLSVVGGCESSGDVRAGAEQSAAASSGLFTPWQTLRGGRLESASAFAGNTLQPTGAYITFLAPSTVAARGQDVYVVDSGKAGVFRVNPYSNSLVVVQPQPKPPTWVAPDYPQRLPSDHGTKLYVAGDRSIYVLDQGKRRILHMSREGYMIQEFQDPSMLTRPVGMTVDESRGVLMVVDATYHNVVAFHQHGRIPYVIVPHDNAVGDLTPVDPVAITTGPEGIYLVDRRKSQVLLMSEDGIILDSFGEGILKQPWTIAVDRQRRVYVGDRLDNSIKVFFGGALLAQIKGSSLRPALQRISDIWIDEDLLYVADEVTGSVEIMRLASPSRK